MQKNSKQKVTNVASIIKMAENLPTDFIPFKIHFSCSNKKNMFHSFERSADFFKIK